MARKLLAFAIFFCILPAVLQASTPRDPYEFFFEQSLGDLTEELEIGMGKIGQPLRVAVTGGSFSPPIDQTLELLGKDRSLARIRRAIDFISTNGQ